MSISRWATREKIALWLPWGCLSLGTVIGILTLYRGAFGDEADNLAVGALVREGYVLYRDVFSHHFPLPYYWVAAVVALCGRSILAVRLSVLLWQMGAFALPMALGHERLPLGLAALIWGLLRLFYKGNMALYSSFCAPAIAVVFILTLSLLNRQSPRFVELAIIGLSGSFAILCDPLAVYAVAVALLSLIVEHPQRGWVAVAILAGMGSVTAGLLAFAGALDDFWQQAILFNAQIYGKYLDTNPMRLRELARMALTGLEITDRAWWRGDPFRQIPTQYTQFDQWVFSGLLYRAACLGLTGLLLWQRKWRSAAYAYFFVAGTLVINKWDFRGQPFVLTAVIASALVFANARLLLHAGRFVRIAGLAINLAVGLAALWLSIRAGFSILQSKASLSAQTFHPWQEEAHRMQDLTCHQPQARLAIYPGGGSIYTYFFSGIKPVARYVFMWPWVADFGLGEVVQTLSQEGTLALVVRQEAIIWERYDTRVYLGPLDEFLKTRYVPLGEGIYRSPALDALCAAQR